MDNIIKKMDILDLFLQNPEREFHVREISQLLKKSPTTISKYLKEYEKKGILKSERKLNHFFFKARNEEIIFKRIKKNFNIDKLYESELIDYIIKEFNYPEAIILFGSFARAEDIPRSDIDICVISPIKKELNLEKFEKKLQRTIQLFRFSREDIKKMKSKNKELLNNLVNGITLYGFWELF